MAGRGAYRRDLDGIRAIAIAMVMADHAAPVFNDLHFGHAGVSLFFGLSGYLITSILLAERRTSGRIDLADFYRRRVRRLAPALVVMAAVVLSVSVAAGARVEALTSLAALATYTANWATSAGLVVTPLRHAWTLAIEEQFYLLWPVLLWLAPRRVLPALLVASLVLDGATHLLLAPVPAYFATTSYIDALGIGCAAAFAGRPLAARWIVAAAPLLVAGIVLDVPLLSAGSAAVACLCRSEALSPLAPVGRRAYGLYLWSWPLAMVLGPAGVVATPVFAELSYRLVEQPFLRSRRRAPLPSVAPAPTVPEIAAGVG